MVEGDLAIPLFLAGTGVTIIVAGISQAGWRHRLLILGLFAVGAVLVLAGLCWHLIGNLLPAVTTVVSGIATSPVAWFVIVMFALAVMLIRNRQNQAAIPMMRPIMPVAAREQQSLPIETGDLSDLIERCWNEHVSNSALARETHGYNVAHAMKEDLKLRAWLEMN
jgi:Kef-type K+ transport system membrane component KefB